MIDLHEIQHFVSVEYADIVVSSRIIEAKVRFYLIDGSLLDCWWSKMYAGRFAFHWDRTAADGSVFRLDNIPHKKWKDIATFPLHFHNGNRDEVIASEFPSDSVKALKAFMIFVRRKIGL